MMCGHPPGHLVQLCGVGGLRQERSSLPPINPGSENLRYATEGENGGTECLGYIAPLAAGLGGRGLLIVIARR